jgi:hypothetical protein
MPTLWEEAPEYPLTFLLQNPEQGDRPRRTRLYAPQGLVAFTMELDTKFRLPGLLSTAHKIKPGRPAGFRDTRTSTPGKADGTMPV